MARSADCNDERVRKVLAMWVFIGAKSKNCVPKKFCVSTRVPVFFTVVPVCSLSILGTNTQINQHMNAIKLKHRTTIKCNNRINATVVSS